METLEQQRSTLKASMKKFLVCCEPKDTQKYWYIADAKVMEDAISVANLSYQNPIYIVPLELVSDIEQEKKFMGKILAVFKK